MFILLFSLDFEGVNNIGTIDAVHIRLWDNFLCEPVLFNLLFG